jgi:hypothetical protein
MGDAPWARKRVNACSRPLFRAACADLRPLTRILTLDESFGATDAQTRSTMQNEFLAAAERRHGLYSLRRALSAKSGAI